MFIDDILIYFLLLKRYAGKMCFIDTIGYYRTTAGGFGMFAKFNLVS